MAKTVFILGAGFSFNAGVPLLGEMLGTVIRAARDRRIGGRPLRAEDAETLSKAVEVRNSMDHYHGRAKFDDRNIEDVLSLLAFDALRSGNQAGAENLEAMTRAIGRLIELTCSVQHPGIGFSERDVIGGAKGPDLYRDFWMALLKWYGAHREIPTIISLNYDLVLERSLLQVLTGTDHYAREPRRAINAFRVDYATPYAPPRPFAIQDRVTQDGRPALVANDALPDDNIDLTIEILKLHGSLNFSAAAPTTAGHFNMAAAAVHPQILPPVFNKTRQGHFDVIWGTALARLASAHNIVVVGYSLPATDMYMQFFLKAALGPNTSIERLVVFDPLLHGQERGGGELRSRYAGCFAEQTHRLINFAPPVHLAREQAGTCASFVRTLEVDPESLLS